MVESVRWLLVHVVGLDVMMNFTFRSTVIFYLGIAELFDHYCNVEYFVVVVEVDGNVKLLVMLLGIRRLACVSY